MNRPHEWVRANLGHSMSYCKNCGGTPNEIAVIGDMNDCPKGPTPPPQVGTTSVETTDSDDTHTNGA